VFTFPLTKATDDRLLVGLHHCLRTSNLSINLLTTIHFGFDPVPELANSQRLVRSSDTI
jgi:hypothetical protein